MSFCDSVLPYQTALWLSSRTEDSSKPRHRIVAPGDSAREALIARKLGINGWGRWQYFRQCFSGRWGDEGQAPVSPKSQDALFKALEYLEFPPASKPSLFLTGDGHFELAWRDPEGRSVQMEFGPSEFEIFIEGSGIEEIHQNSLIGEIIADRFTTR
ncbi:MAG: hypothetical protein K9N23_01395 [Akkermansiaceae bacterium]|nr:hypothetical protein [Akkermansiaceae bacterium]MCF7730305.1 hypothetical protein [Akkermansiaceae bacterium]